MPCKMLITVTFWIAKRFDNITTLNIEQLKSSVVRTGSNNFAVWGETSTTNPICVSSETRYEFLISNGPQLYLLVVGCGYQLTIKMLSYILPILSLNMSTNYLTTLGTKIHVSNSWCVSVKLWRWTEYSRSPDSNSSVWTCCNHQITTRWPIHTIDGIRMTTEFITSNWTVQIP